MPFPRNWSEELVWEWLSLQGYLAEVGIPVGTGGRGGRLEADIVGTKIDDNGDGKQVLQVFHVEIGSLPRDLERNIQAILKKFSQNTIDTLIKRFQERMGHIPTCRYRKVYIDTWATKSKIQRLSDSVSERQPEIEIWGMWNLYEEVAKSVQNWKSSPGYLTKTQPSLLALPESYWMLHLVEDLRRNQERRE